jgi:hypothetical protein
MICKLNSNLFAIHYNEKSLYSCYTYSDNIEPIVRRNIDPFQIYFYTLLTITLAYAAGFGIKVHKLNSLDLIIEYSIFNPIHVIRLRLNEIIVRDKECYKLIQYNSGAVISYHNKILPPWHQAICIDDNKIFIYRKLVIYQLNEIDFLH